MIDCTPLYQLIDAEPPATQTKKNLRRFIQSYCKAALHSGSSDKEIFEIAKKFVELVLEEEKNPSSFDYFHQRIKEPFNYSEFGLTFIGQLIDWKNSSLSGDEYLVEMEKAVKRGENVILFANHQVEPDPQSLYLTLQEKYPLLSEKMIFVAGDRVVHDPFAIPLSLGCNLLCIYSKKYIDTPPEEKEQKLLHNKKTMSRTEELLKSGGQIIYVAPSGGRDRKKEDGTLLPAPFNPNSIEMFYLLARRAKTRTHFHTLALYTYPILPPPEGVNIQLGEERLANYTPIHLKFGPSFAMENNDLSEIKDKRERRSKRAALIYQRVLDDYAQLPCNQH